MEKAYTVGIDEVGRGPLAGPMTLGAVCVEKSHRDGLYQKLLGIADSKKLSEKKRNMWYEQIKSWQDQELISVALASTSADDIDAYGISQCLQTGVLHVLEKLNIPVRQVEVLLDGGLVAPAVYAQQRSIVGGDTSEPLISLASIAAKVSRDQEMVAYDAQHPQYGFASHKGYGTKQHRAAIKAHGPCVLHRQSFLGNIVGA